MSKEARPPSGKTGRKNRPRTKPRVTDLPRVKLNSALQDISLRANARDFVDALDGPGEAAAARSLQRAALRYAIALDEERSIMEAAKNRFLRGSR